MESVQDLESKLPFGHAHAVYFSAYTELLSPLEKKIKVGEITFNGDANTCFDLCYFASAFPIEFCNRGRLQRRRTGHHEREEILTKLCQIKHKIILFNE